MDFASLIYSAIAVITGIVVHESAHALCAYLLGDKTARSQGRVSINPLAHIDPFGTIVLPLIMLLAGGPVFAFAKPVPIYLGNLKHPKRDELLIALAGPLSNIVLAVVAAGCGFVFFTGPATSASYEMATDVFSLLAVFISVNLSLAFFTLIPLPPLDGSSIIVPFLHGNTLASYYRIQRYSMPILITVLYLLPSVMHIDLIGVYFNFTVYPLARQLLMFALSGF